MDNQKELNAEELDQVNGGGLRHAAKHSSLIIKSKAKAAPVIVENEQNVGTAVGDATPKPFKSAPVIEE